jgi:hypothetical protein
MISSQEQNNRMISKRNQNSWMNHDLTAWTGCINVYKMIIFKRENEMNFESKYLYLLNRLVWLLPIPWVLYQWLKIK